MRPWTRLFRAPELPIWAYTPTATGLLLQWQVGEKPIPPGTPGPTGSPIPASHPILRDLLEQLSGSGLLVEGQPAVSVCEDGYLVSIPALYAGYSRHDTDAEDVQHCRDFSELAALVVERFPGECAAGLHLRADGDFNAPEFRIRYDLRILPARPYAQQQVGPFLLGSNGSVEVLPWPVFRLLSALRDPWPRDPFARMRRWAALRPLVSAADAELDPYLANEDIVLVDRIRPTPAGFEAGRLTLRPGVDHPLDEDLAGAVSRFTSIHPLYTLPGEGQSGRVRFVPGEEATQALGFLKDHPGLSGDDLVRSVQCPESVFTAPGFDLEEYSDRVVGLGVYVYRAVPYMGGREGARDWFQWDGEGDLPEVGLDLLDDTAPEAATRVALTKPDELAQLKERLADAEARGQEYVEIQPGRFAPREDVAGWVRRAEELAEAATPRERRKLILRILENIEDRDYAPLLAQPVEQLELLPPPAELAPSYYLMPHQVVGYSWLSHLASGDARTRAGGLLADDMGLGKTLQVLCALARRRAQGTGRPVLVVAPVSVLENWQREAQAFFPTLFRSLLILSSDPRLKAAEMTRYDLVLTSYETLRGPVQFEAGKVEWDVVILDEAQKVKNPTTRASITVKSLKARLRVALTATPVENSLAELWNIVDFLHPGHLGALREFHREHILGWQNADEPGRARLAEALVQKLRPILLRRTKDEVLDLPPKVPERLEVRLSPTQARLYAAVLARLREEGVNPLATLTALFKVCAHPGLVDPAALSETCPKLQATLDLFDTIRIAGEKALIFTASLRMQALLHQHLQQRFRLDAPIINGSTDPRQRQSLIDGFSAHPGFGVLILGPRAAGLGLNITAANHVIHYTREWNPAVEAQATDRAYRIGQTRPVTVYYPIVHGDGAVSVEQTLDQLLYEKSILARSIVRPTSELTVTAVDLLQRLHSRT